MIIKESQSAHWYRSSGEPAHDATLREARKEQLLPSVTSIIKAIYPKPQLQRWITGQLLEAADKNPRVQGELDESWSARVIEASNEIRDRTAAWGIDFHQAVEHHCKGIQTSVSAEMYPFYEEYAKWHSANVLDVTGMEGVVTQSTLGYAGRYDVKFNLKGMGSCLCDIKSRDVKKKKPLWYDEQPMQLVAYSFAMKDKPEHLMSMVINRLTPEPPYIKVYTQAETDVAMSRWSACLELWKQIKQYFPNVKIEGSAHE